MAWRRLSRHGHNAAMAQIKLRGLGAIDRRTVAAREVLAFKRELVAALGGEADLSPQRRRLIDMTARAAYLVDHIDASLFEQPSLINGRTRSLLPVVIQRQTIAEHLARLLERLGLDRIPRKVPDLRTYLAERVTAQNGRPAPEPQQADLPAEAHEPAAERTACTPANPSENDTEAQP